jgi:hypothetical protein
MLLFAVGLGALGIGGAVAIHLTASLNEFQRDIEEIKKELEILVSLKYFNCIFKYLCPRLLSTLFLS